MSELSPPLASADAPASPEAPRRKMPRLRLRLRSVLVLVSLMILMLPLLGLYALRLHETTLLQRTQDDLTIAAAALASSFATALAVAESGTVGLPASTAFATPRLDFASAPVKAPLPAPQAAGSAQPAAAAAGRQLASALAATAGAIDGAIRLLDADGVVVATTSDDLGLSLGHLDEVAEALAGEPVSSLRAVGDDAAGQAQALVRGARVAVVLAIPVGPPAAPAGVVLLSRQPANILDTLHLKRGLLVQGGTVFLAVAVAIALLTARTLVLPIQRLARAAARVSRGETDRFERYRHYRVYELADLADSVEAMVSALQRRAAYLRDFAHHLSHEFKTPIAAARGALELLRDDLQDMQPTEAKRFVTNVGTDIDRLEHLTTRLVALAQADMARLGDETTDVLAAAREIKAVTVAASAEPAKARIARSALTAVLSHLADNARQHGATEVTIAVQAAGEMVEVRVRDDGTGVSPGNQSRIFDPFFTTRQADGGSGLGLAICRTLLRNAGGDIELEAEAGGASGAVFKIVLRRA